ncbi:DUF87 domain-containing protein [uncultured Brachyspira sp.]|uniref:ATP-binding protein n=1 Tax=uncultured Brachyspira sp. TaxID=221953 RepID=UPI00258FDF47|nr:DUF87 domain-containing protein [uncultured Brachyspira sp.]
MTANEIDNKENNTKLKKFFEEESKNLGNLTVDFIKDFYPSYSVNNDIAKLEKENSLDLLNSFTFYKICECKIYNVDDRFEYFLEKLKKLFIAAYSMNRNVYYGIVGDNGNVSLVLGVDAKNDENETILSIIKGLLSGIKIEKYDKKFVIEKDDNGKDKKRFVGCISGVPAVKIDGEYQKKDLSPLIRSLNKENYTIMILCKPLKKESIQNKINEAINIQDKCFAISKRTLSLQTGKSEGETHTETEGVNYSKTQSSNFIMRLVDFFRGSQTETEGKSESVSKAISKTINENESISGDIQNGFAIELMKMAESTIERLKIGRNIGMWETVISYSSDSKLAMDIIQGSLYSEIASEVPEILPPVVFSYKNAIEEQAIIPKGFFENEKDYKNNLCSLITSEEICGICSIPIENTFGFEINESKGYALNYLKKENDKTLGYVCEYDNLLDNVPFGLSEEDLNKHVFVCGITGSGKTNTVKKILESVNEPFLVIEPVKKEYRNIKKDIEVYTMGRPEINCIKMNPFYVPMGISLQQHIDSLKDLFSASFSFYGPMPYIFEKCLYNIYEKKGWNLTFGLHSYYLEKYKNNLSEELFDNKKLEEFYKTISHKYLFPNMQDLKEEVANYIKTMSYEGELKGNIEGAIKARIDSLCVGAKGYMFNTNDMFDFDIIFNQNSVFELEGLADDSDKAFALGLLIIYINEYRQVDKEINNKKGLKHLLVIEEAHRLLKNVSTEKNEDIGNPKGKAVEHFTNMLAEMRSYGQGVIVAEQIPTKLAPDVIKNSSNKIVHRIIAKDDQEVIANTIGIYPEDAIYLGNSKTGYALCHKEGMVQPVIVKIDEVESNNISDKNLYEKNIDEKIKNINKSIIKNQLSEYIPVWAVKTLVSIMYNPNDKELYEGLDFAYNETDNKIRLDSISLIKCNNKKDYIIECINEAIISLLVSGVFSNHKLPTDEFVSLIDEIIHNPIILNDVVNKEDEQDECEQDITKKLYLLNEFENFYNGEPKNKSVEIVAQLVSKEYSNNYNITQLINDFTLKNNNQFIEDVKNYLEYLENKEEKEVIK